MCVCVCVCVCVCIEECILSRKLLLGTLYFLL